MTGYDIYEKSMLLMGMGDNSGEITAGTAILPLALDAVNQIGFDLSGMPPKKNLFEEVTICDKALSAMPYGVGMMLSMSIGLARQNQLLSELYNAKRASVKADTSKIADRLPVTGVEV